ncbi:hypothetical protein LJC26_05755 [Desulfovibrio sp. OttesenSCG-928-O18]|nr:hypothetical protein [Desulfovibrio sp. OttesenSCG-928-O18]
MNFSKELCQFVIRNAVSLDGGVVDAVQVAVFKAINARVEKRFKALGGWKGKYELLTGEADVTLFAPAAWPEDKNGRLRAGYELTEVRSDKNNYWLSSVLGVNGVKMCFRFWVHGGLGGHTKGEIERKLVTLSNSTAVKEAGMSRDEDNTIYLPFSFDSETLAAEYPIVDKTLVPLEAALDKLLSVNELFDAVVRELASKK